MAVGKSRKKSALGNRSRRVLMMGDDGIVLYGVEKKKATRIISMPWETAQFEEKLVTALKSGYSGSVILLYDAVEQHYRKDKVRKAGAMDRQKMINRKLNLAFQNFSIKAALELKQKKGSVITLKRPTANDQLEFLFAALPKSENLNRLVAVLYESEVSIMGLGLLPVESVGLVEDLTERCVERQGGVKSKWSVLIGQHETGGIRQIVVKDGNLAMARLTPVAENINEAGLAAEIIREFKATISYIARYGYSTNDGLDIVIVAPKEAHNALKSANLTVSNLCLLDLPDALAEIGGRYAGETTQTYADALHVLWAAKKTRLAMPMKMSDLDRVSLPRKVAELLVVAAFIAGLGMLYTMYNSYSVYADRLSQSEFRTTQRDALTREYAQESTVFDELPMRPVVVSSVIEIKRMLQQNSVDLTPIMQNLKDALAEDFIIENLNMQHRAAENSSINPDRLNNRGRGAAAQPPMGYGDEQTQTGPDRGEVTISFTVRLTERGLPLEEKVLRGEALLDRLRARFANHEVEIDRQFGGVTRTGAFSIAPTSGEAISAEEIDTTAEFTIMGPPL